MWPQRPPTPPGSGENAVDERDTTLKNSVRNEAQLAGIGAIVVAVAVLVLFFALTQAGLGSGNATTTSAPAQSDAAKSQ
jgi:hypothetical protein